MNAKKIPSRRQREFEAQQQEYSRIARDPGTGSRWKRRLVLLVAAVLAAPVLWLSVRFSLEVGSIGFYVFALDGDTGTKVGVVVLTLLGFLGLTGTLAFLWIGFVRARVRTPWAWAGLALACAAALPVSWLLLGLTGGA
ncbi:hypothetical protein [Brevibacterium samyangense]|uniref:Uncharacterized protein n=1 Tax=Brevibacterium samyangense TaxID=366888 RepID=A0ABN2T4U9_9MICO